jgi:phage N-6-adenine-methyltransferase
VISNALYSSRSEEWATPQAFYDALDLEFHFTLDAAASKENAKCSQYIDKGQDALNMSWNYFTTGDRVWCNPPYGRSIGKWFAKARAEAARGALVVMLAHARTDTQWWHEHVQGIATEVRFVKGRLRFGDSKNSAPFPSAVIIYDGRKNQS